MNSLTAPTIGDEQEDARIFADLLEQVGARVECGDSAAARAIIDEHPVHADRLRRVLPAIEALAAFEESGAAVSSASAAIADVPNRTLGDFRILREVGRGGMGVVYEAEQISLGRRVALKVLPFASLLDARQLERFKNEARVAAGLHHTNIVPVYTVGSERGVYYYAMQFIEGHDLANVIEETRLNQGTPSRPKSPTLQLSANASTARDEQALVETTRRITSRERFRIVAEWAATLADALAYAHSLGVLHRDIKPANLMLDDAGTIWIGDFGLARMECDAGMTMPGDFVGTLRYMSPELAQGDHASVGARTDIYALGATLYELLTLRPAFDAADRRQLLRQISDIEPQAPRRFDPAIPADLETIVLKAMSKDAASRYATAQHLADDLRRFLENKSIEARRPTLLDWAAKWSRRHVAMISIAAAALAVVTIACLTAVLLTFNAYKSEAEQRTNAETNLSIAASAIDRSLARAANAHYEGGDLSGAEKLATDATEFYEELLKHTADPNHQFRAANAYQDVTVIWNLAGQDEKARNAAERIIELVTPLIAESPVRPEYLAVRAYAYVHIALPQFHQSQFDAAEESYQSAKADFERLVKLAPQEPRHHLGLAGVISGLADVYFFQKRWDEAEANYQRAAAIFDDVPKSFYDDTPDAVARHAGLFINWSMLCCERGDYDRSIEHLKKSLALEKQSLASWSTNPMARDFLYKHFQALTKIQLRAGRPAAAAVAVEELIGNFPDRVSAYQLGTVTLLRCVALAENPPSSAKQMTSKTPSPLGGGPGRGNAADTTTANTYRQRARELVDHSTSVRVGTPQDFNDFAWYILTAEDESIRNPQAALELANRATHDAPADAGAWFTLALAHYRNGDWHTADEAVHNSIKFEPANAFDWLLFAMIRHQQGRTDEARESFKKATDWIAEDEPDDQALLALAVEAEGLILPDDESTPAPKSGANSNQD